MKKINSVWGGRFTVVFLSILCFILITLNVVGVVLDGFEWIYILPFTLLLLFATINRIQNGYLSYLQIDDLKICNKDYSLNWKNVYITVSIIHNVVYSSGSIVIMYIDDHYLNEDEIKNKEFKMFMVVTPLITKRQEYILTRYYKKVEFIAKSQDDRYKVFLEHNEKYH